MPPTATAHSRSVNSTHSVSIRSPNHAILLVTSPDRRGLVARITEFISRHGGNVVYLDQHVDRERPLFLMRVEWELDGFALTPEQTDAEFGRLAAELSLDWRIAYKRRVPRVAILVSRQDHCLADLLHRQRTGELRCEIAAVISNHEDTREIARFHGCRFEHVPVVSGAKAEAEQRQLELIDAEAVDLVVLARYMQVLTPEFVARYRHRIINIHHSFLPAFLGAKPYHRAFERGVKLIGATAHYVTESLDEGPIIEQDVSRVSHRDDVEDLVEKGRDLEKVVLARAVRWHLDHRVLVHGNKTVVFE